jgi:ABC-2 type transport system permease protein
MTAFFALIRMDLKLFLADPRAVLMSVVAPIAIASFFGYIFGGGAGDGGGRIPIIVADLDRSSLTREITNRLQSDQALDLKLDTPDHAREAVRKGKARTALVFPQGFTAQMVRALVAQAQKPTVELLFDPSDSIEMRMVEGTLMGAAMRAAATQVLGGRGEISVPYQVHSEAITSGRGITYNGYAHSFGGMGIQFLLMVGVEVGVALLVRRQRGVWKRLRAAPLSRWMLLGSRTASSAITSICTLIVIFGFARLVFGVRIQGSLLGFLGICVAFSLMTATFGLLLATIGGTPEATRGVAILVTLLMVMLGGAWVPTFIFPKWLQALTVVIPTRWAMDGLDAVTWRGLGFSAVALPIALLAACALAFGAFAVWRFRWEAD